MEPWRTAIATSDATGIWIRGRDLTSLMKDATFTDLVKVLFDMARAEGVAGDGILFMEALEAQAARRIKALPMNIDGALAAILHDMGFPPPAGRFMFIIGRVAGLTAEVAEELAREKPM